MSNICVILRILLGGIFIVSGLEKLMASYQDFLYVVQGYEFLNSFLEGVVARVFPWVEFLLGIFLVLGLWTSWALRGISVLIFMFLCIVGQALLRGLDLSECGCFGSLFSFPLHVVLIFDSVLLCLFFFLMTKKDLVRNFSLDRYMGDS